MKFTFGPGSVGKPIPRILNPLLFLGVVIMSVLVAAVMVLGAAFMLIAAAITLLWAPFSWMTVVRAEE